MPLATFPPDIAVLLPLKPALERIEQCKGSVPHLARWCQQSSLGSGERTGTTISDAKRIKDLEEENEVPNRANEMAESTGRSNATDFES